MLENYAVNDDGLIYQISKPGFVYDKQYIYDRYDTYGSLNDKMSFLRLGYVLGTTDNRISSIMDIGYGNGAFLKACNTLIPNCYGFDVTGYPIPDGSTFVDNWMEHEVDVVTFFDVIEHLDSPYVIRNLKTKYIVISLPWCHYKSDEWFSSWKHRRENEHLWFFNEKNITQFAKSTGYEVVHYCNIEDSIRGPLDGSENILTFTLKKI